MANISLNCPLQTYHQSTILPRNSRFYRNSYTRPREAVHIVTFCKRVCGLSPLYKFSSNSLLLVSCRGNRMNHERSRCMHWTVKIGHLIIFRRCHSREANNYSCRWKKPVANNDFPAGRFSLCHLFKSRDHRRHARPLWCLRRNTLSWKLDERRRAEHARTRKGCVYSFSQTSLTNGGFNYSNNKNYALIYACVAIKYNVITILFRSTHNLPNIFYRV